MQRFVCLAGLACATAVNNATANGFINVTEAPCFLDNTGTNDVTAALQRCISIAYGLTVPRVPLFFPSGRYLVNDTIVFEQQNPWGRIVDDGINVVPGRFLPHIAWGSAAIKGPAGVMIRPTIVLRPNSPGFDGSKPKPVVLIYQSGGGEGCDMNNLFKGIDIDITAEGNPGAAGISHNGAQGAVVTDVTVRASPDAYACFLGCNGAGGGHHVVACYGARYGFSIVGAQPVPSIVGALLVNQTVSAIDFQSQESLSLVGTRIVVLPGATGAGAITAYSEGMSIIDVSIECTGGSAGTVTGIHTPSSLYLRDVYVSGCGTAVDQTGVPALPGPAGGDWLHVSEWAKGVDPMPYFHSNVIYQGGQRADGGAIAQSAVLPGGSVPPADLYTRHLWDESSFPGPDSPNTADARLDCGAQGDNVTDDTASLQACLNSNTRVFLPPGLYRISSTLTMQPGSALVGMGNGASYLLAATTGFPSASSGSPQPMLQTARDDEGQGIAKPTVIAFVGLVTWQHLANVYTLLWLSQHPLSVWRVNFESRDCECLWISAYQALDPPALPCSLPVNMTIPKSVFSGLGRVYNFVNDDTGAIISTGAKYRDMAVYDTSAFATSDARLRFYSANLEHCQSEACSEMQNVSFVDMYSMKSEGNMPVAWIRAPAANVSILSLGGGLTAMAYNYTFPSDFEQITASYFRADAGTTGIKFALLQDHGYGAAAPYWPPEDGGCVWKHGFPYPGASVPLYPFWTYPNVTMWNCWYGQRVATAYWHMIVDGASGTAFMDKPVYYMN